MKVRDLIRVLSEMPPDLEVYRSDGEHGPLTFDEDDVEIGTVTNLARREFPMLDHPRDKGEHYYLDRTARQKLGTKIVVIG